MKFYIYFLFSLSTLYSQNSGIASYKILLPEYNKTVDNDGTRLMQQAKLVAENQIYILEFNDKQSHFFKNKNMENDIDENKLVNGVASIIVGNENYYDRYQNISINENVYGILLKDNDPKKNWVISTETKLIDNYKCYKAEYIESYKNSNGATKTRSIIAWFSPSLPYPYGPRGYNGLPGLVLELFDKDKATTMIIKSIDIKQNPIEIKFPKGKVITVEEYMKNSNFIPR